jgi:hypothetical protein
MHVMLDTSVLGSALLTGGGASDMALQLIEQGAATHHDERSHAVGGVAEQAGEGGHAGPRWRARHAGVGKNRTGRRAIDGGPRGRDGDPAWQPPGTPGRSYGHLDSL